MWSDNVRSVWNQSEETESCENSKVEKISGKMLFFDKRRKIENKYYTLRNLKMNRRLSFWIVQDKLRSFKSLVNKIKRFENIYFLLFKARGSSSSD